jgi:hypothetical protein
MFSSWSFLTTGGYFFATSFVVYPENVMRGNKELEFCITKHEMRGKNELTKKEKSVKVKLQRMLSPSQENKITRKRLFLHDRLSTQCSSSHFYGKAN